MRLVAADAYDLIAIFYISGPVIISPCQGYSKLGIINTVTVEHPARGEGELAGVRNINTGWMAHPGIGSGVFVCVAAIDIGDHKNWVVVAEGVKLTMATPAPAAERQVGGGTRIIDTVLGHIKISIQIMISVLPTPIHTFKGIGAGTKSNSVFDKFTQSGAAMAAQESVGITRSGATTYSNVVVADHQMATLATGLVMAGGGATWIDRVHQALVAAIAADSARPAGGIG